MELLGSSERIQQLLSVSMSEASKLRQGIDRLRLLEQHIDSNNRTKRNPGEVGAAAEVEDRANFSTFLESPRPAELVNYASAKSSSWGLGVGLGAITAAAMLYMVAASEWFSAMGKVRGALQLTDSGSIVPYGMKTAGCDNSEECQRISLKIFGMISVKHKKAGL
jgi:hypothetical protein